MATATRPPRAADEAAPEAEAKPRRKYVRKPGLSVPMDEARRKTLRQMAQTAGAPFSDFLASLFVPFVDQQVKDFEENRTKIAAHARVIAARAAADRARSLLAEAEAEEARIAAEG